jgi:dual specificity phosphatase 12
MPEKAWMEEIVPGLFLGNIASSYNKELLQNNKITAIVSLTSRYQLFWDTTTQDAGITPERHMWAQVQDAKWEDLLSLMKDICDFIDSVAPPQLSSLTALPVPVPLAEGVVEEVAGSSEPRIPPPHAVLIHCVCGVSRSSTIIAAYLMRKLQMERDAVLQFVKSRKGHIHPNSGFFSQLKLWHESKYTGWENKGRSLVIWSCLVPD